MTRSDQLRWWQEGFTAGLAAARAQGAAEHARAAAEFAYNRHADQQNRIDADLAEVIDVLARALLPPATIKDGPRRRRHADTGT